MHPVGLYLAATDLQRQHRATASLDRRAESARANVQPNVDLEQPTRLARLTAIVRRRVIRTAGA